MIRNLVKLQHIDTQLTDIDELLGDLPIRVDELNNQEKSLIDEVAQNKERIKEIELSCSKNEGKLLDLKEKIEKHKDQLFLVTNNKQYDAIMNEMDHLKQEKDLIETEELLWLEEKDGLESSTTEKEESLESLTADLGDRRIKLERVISESAEEKSVLEVQRNDAAQGIAPPIIALYNKVIKARNGLAVVEIVNSSCGGCGAIVPIQTVSEIKNSLAVHNCGSCGRFLYKEKSEKV
ncbi:MAG: hypothetical protein ISR83_09640 [Candidatus Marinimicrobia bacterium]|nr:hypothetical protein [Candidatus Neomarinimicrobiota bacterium]